MWLVEGLPPPTMVCLRSQRQCMDQAVIVFPLRSATPVAPDEEVLLIRKKRGLGAGLYNGPGGKVEPDESPSDAAVRETREEVRLNIGSLDRRARLEFYFGDEPLFECFAYTTTEFSGEAAETPEADPVWTQRSKIPYDDMWEDDQHWLPHVLDGQSIEGVFEFDAEGDELESWTVEAVS